MSKARAHFQAVTAGAESARPADQPTPLKARMLAVLQAHMASLKQIKSRQAKIQAKQGMLPDYEAYVAGVLSADAGGDDAVLVTVMVWRLDASDWTGGLAIAEYAIRHNLTLPRTFARDLPTLVLEQVAETALAQIQDAEIDPDMVDALEHALDLTEDADMPDEVRSKAHKALGLLIAETDPANAVSALKTALKLDRKAGVKGDINRLEKRLGGADVAPDPPPPDSSPPAGPAGPNEPPPGDGGG